MQVQVIPARGLTLHQIEAWSQLQETNPDLDSAFFRPEFSMAVAGIRDDVEVGILRHGGAPAGFFPFQRGRNNFAQSVVGRLSEFHGVVAGPGVEWEPEQLLRGCGLSAWYFDHLPAAQTPFARFSWARSQSPYIDLAGGFDAYIAQRCNAGSSVIAQVRRKSRKIAREVGPLRFELHTSDEQVWQALLKWKTAQHRQAGMLQVLDYPWVVALLERIRRTQTEQFSGLLSALYAGNQLAAVHLGLKGSSALHIWFPAYNTRLSKYSPGLILLLEMARGAARLGLRRIDFGKGSERYKANFKSGDLPLLVGGIDFRFAPAALRCGWRHLKLQIESSRWRRQLQTPLLATRRFRQWLAFR